MSKQIRMVAVRNLLVVALFIYVPFKSMAWGMLGHRIVGEIAAGYITPQASKEIQKILGTESIAMAANWADFIKSDSTYDYLDTWHYVNVDKGLHAQQMQTVLQKDTAVNAYTRINFLVKQLRNKNLPKDKKVLYLRLLIHLVGDIHQPLHASANGTRGGNDVKVSWFGQSSNLHRVWDSQLIDYQQLSYTEYVKAINFATAKQRTAWQKQPITQWIYESYSISNHLHNEIKPDEKLSYLYNFKHVDKMNLQLLKGGVRLAGLLNELFG